MAVAAVHRPIVRSFDSKYTKEAAAHARAGGHAVVWTRKPDARGKVEARAVLVFREPADGDIADLGRWSVYDLGKSRWKIAEDGALKGLATTLVPRDCHWIVKRRAERDAIHPGPTRKVAFDCLACGSCCQDNEVVLEKVDLQRFVDGGRRDLTKPPLAKRDAEGRLLLTLLANKRCRHLGATNLCGIYEIRPDACSEFPMGSECCLFAREDLLGLVDGAQPES